MKLTKYYFKIFEGITPGERRHIVSITLDGLSEVFAGFVFPSLRGLSIYTLLGLSLVSWGVWHYIICRFEKWMKKTENWIDLSSK